jgi:hypothetical protein
MAIKITKLSPFVDKRWPATCLACKTEFTYQYPDIETTVFVPTFPLCSLKLRCPLSLLWQ